MPNRKRKKQGEVSYVPFMQTQNTCSQNRNTCFTRTHTNKAKTYKHSKLMAYGEDKNGGGEWEK